MKNPRAGKTGQLIHLVFLLLLAACLPLEPSAVQPTRSVTPTLSSPGVNTPAQSILPVVEGAPWLEVQNGRLLVLFMLKNPDPTMAVEQARADIALYDADGNQLDQPLHTYVIAVPPGETKGAATSLYLKEGAEPVSAKISIDSVTWTEPGNLLPSPNIQRADFFQDAAHPQVTAVLENPTDTGYTSIEMVCLLLDRQRNLIGGGFTYVDFLHPHSSTGARITVMGSQQPASGAFFTSNRDHNRTYALDEALQLEVTGTGFSQQGSAVNVAFIYSNTSPEKHVISSQYQIAVYDRNGRVLQTAWGFFGWLAPGAQSGGNATLYLREDSVASSIEVQMLPQKEDELPHQPPNLMVSQARFQRLNSYHQTTAIITNPGSSIISWVDVVAVAYNRRGEIIGGGRTYIKDMPANSEQAVEIILDLDQAPVKVDIFPSPRLD